MLDSSVQRFYACPRGKLYLKYFLLSLELAEDKV